jgi:Zn-dependent peptidase ImmA (M78 family)
MINNLKQMNEMGTRGTKKNKSEKSSPDLIALDLMRSASDFICFAKQHNCYEGESLNIEKLINLIPDMEIIYVPLDSTISGSLSKLDNKWIIKVNNCHNPKRQRFTIAHELGHYVFHKEDNDSFTDTTFFRGMSNDGLEYTANKFASELLMPENSVRKLINIQNIRNIADLADKFDVSAAAMLYRVKQIGYKTKE